MLVAMLGILLYLWFRFEWPFAVGATVATLHDVVLTIGFFSATSSTSISHRSLRC